MRTTVILSLLFACSCGGGGGECAEPEVAVYCQAVEIPGGAVTPGFVVTNECGDITVTDDYGYTEHGQTAAEDWTTMYLLATGLGPAQGECLALEPADLVGRQVLDYSLGRPAQFVLLATAEDVEAFLNR